MRVLWFSGNPSLYDYKRRNFDGGWVSSLELLIRKEKDIDLAISFVHKDEVFKAKEDDVTYYPMPLYNSLKKRIKRNVFYSSYDQVELSYYLKVIEDFKPDVIHVFGTEKSLGTICKHVDVPVVIHIQGILAPYLNAYFIPGVNISDYLIYNNFNPLRVYKELSILRKWKHNVKRELEIIKACRFFMGRTSWDKGITQLLSPNASYFYCSELLRDAFYEAKPWGYKKTQKLTIISTISAPIYKGYDVILKTAKILKDHHKDVDFEWNVFGISESVFIEKKIGIKHQDVGVHLKGVANADTLISQMQESNIYIHLSYIENSPNSVCEAQLLGLPVICANVGGTSSLVEHLKTGVLVPANDPYITAHYILDLFNTDNLAATLGANARETALARHSKESIKSDVINTYNKILDI